jgi:hypothetical protein
LVWGGVGGGVRRGFAVCALPITDCTRRLTETLVCLREQSSRRVVATFLDMVRESLR